MTARNPATPSNWVDPDDGPEWTDEMMAIAELSIGGVVIRPATEVLTKDGCARSDARRLATRRVSQ